MAQDQTVHILDRLCELNDRLCIFDSWWAAAQSVFLVLTLAQYRTVLRERVGGIRGINVVEIKIESTSDLGVKRTFPGAMDRNECIHLGRVFLQ